MVMDGGGVLEGGRMRWFYYLWLSAFTAGRIYGKKAITFSEEKPIYVSGLNEFLYQLEENKAPRWLRRMVEDEIELNDPHA